MNVEYWISTNGAPSSARILAPTLQVAIDDFRDYVFTCNRFGNACSDAILVVECTKWDRTYKVGPRGSIMASS